MQALYMLDEMQKGGETYWSRRILAELGYACRLSNSKGDPYKTLLDETTGQLYAHFKDNGSISADMARQAESQIAVLSPDARKLKIICAAHAHIDMNWMWNFAETVAVTLDTFRTMLNLMNEYPEFKFSQSQASVYKIVEEYDPAMLEEIKARVREGRWEVTASTWVEADKNMPTGESLSRHILYTKQYLSRILDINPDTLELDFEPDTFGHSRNVPEILAGGGVKYYYHCRGFDDHAIYNWRSPSGSSLLAFRDPDWYLGPISPDMAMIVPSICGKYGVDTFLNVYGVGDHGGGPTRRDIEFIRDMASWPVFPAVRFGTITEFFKILEKSRDRFPVVDQELNPIFTGCYTSQSRIKMANRIGEAKLFEAEAFGALSAVFAGGTYRPEAFAANWQKILFNHFHDILTGSGVIDTREYALGEFQKVLAFANTETSRALQKIASRIDTSGLAADPAGAVQTTSEGAGVGFAIKDFSLPQTERGRGKNRIFHVFNPSSHDRISNAEITVWDWDVSPDRIQVRDSRGRLVRHQLLENEARASKQASYWGHTFIRLLAETAVPAFGYSTLVLSESGGEDGKQPDDVPNYAFRTEKPDRYVMENNKVRIVFDTSCAAILSFEDRQTGMEMLDTSRPAGIFRVADEDDAKGMTAWIVGRMMNIGEIRENVKITAFQAHKDALRQSLKFKVDFRRSSLDVTVSLDHDSTFLRYDAECHWLENAVMGKSVPQLHFYFPFGHPCEKYLYDIPAGTIARDGADMDLPANSWAAGIPAGSGMPAAMVMTDTKYGFRCIDQSISVTLIRSSYDPDPYPEIGTHRFHFAAGFADVDSNAALVANAFDFNHPLRCISGTVHGGDRAPEAGFLSLEQGSAVLSAVKMPEEGQTGNRLLIRVYESEGRESRTVIRLDRPAKSAFFADTTEKRVETGGHVDIDGERIRFTVGPGKLASVIVEFQ